MQHPTESEPSGLQLLAADARGACALLAGEFLIVVAPDRHAADDFDDPAWAAYLALPPDHLFAGLRRDHPILPPGWLGEQRPPRAVCRELGLRDYADHRDWLMCLSDHPEDARAEAIQTAAVLRRVSPEAVSRQDVRFLLDSDDPEIREFAATRLHTLTLGGAEPPQSTDAPIVEGCVVTEVPGPGWSPGAPGRFHLLRDSTGRHFLRDLDCPSGVARWNWREVEPCEWPEGFPSPPSGDCLAVRVVERSDPAGREWEGPGGEYLLLRRGETFTAPGAAPAGSQP